MQVQITTKTSLFANFIEYAKFILYLIYLSFFLQGIMCRNWLKLLLSPKN